MAVRRYIYKRKTNRGKKLKKISGVFFIVSGLALLAYFFLPILSFYIFVSTNISEINIESPIPKISEIAGNTPLASLFKTNESYAEVNTYDARNWFPEIESFNKTADIKEYMLSIPSQGIFNAKVSVNDFDLSKHLVQYYSTSKNPADKGTSVIFGHSTLPQWFNPNDYTKIFAKIHTLKLGDEIVITVEGKKYKYKILSKTIVDRKDPKVFYKNFDNSYLSLVTCTPPGTKWKRLIVRAVLENNKLSSL